ncbi:hypothetical protein SLA2020_318980 [Shorea laevis]
MEFDEEFAVNLDYIGKILDECLVYIFKFLGVSDRKQCSLVCKRWLLVDGRNHYRLSFSTRLKIIDSLPSIFTHFDSINKLALYCEKKSISLSDEPLVLISTGCPNLSRLKLRGCHEIIDYGMARFVKATRILGSYLVVHVCLAPSH